MDKEKSTKISFGMFICCIIIVLHHSVGHVFYDLTYDETKIVNFLHYGIFTFTMPFFFFWSGYFATRKLSSQGYKCLIENKIKSVIVPYFSWNILWTIFAVALSFNTFVEFSNTIAWNHTLHDLLQGIFLFKFNGQYWYMLNLFLLVLISPVIKYICNHRVVFWCVFIFCILCNAYSISFFSFQGLLLYLIGTDYYLNKDMSFFSRMEDFTTRISSLILVALFIIMILV